MEAGEDPWKVRRASLLELGARTAAGSVAPLRGLNAYDAGLAQGFRRAAVLLLFTPPADGSEPDLFLVQRSRELRHHPGEIALPGGRLEAGESAVDAALRETHEEIGLDPAHVDVLGELGPVLVPVTRFVVAPVLGWTDHAHEAAHVEPGEVLHTIRVSVGALTDPGARRTVNIFGRRTAGFLLPDGLVWGMTANLLDHVLAELGWAREWDTTREVTMRREDGGRVWVPEL
ncbi:NUDIX hydrolase [Georgenia sp. SUBG003]|uniref:NUDIX hydrolase n=1 Tax=Georgenia sp. SUBG003 TaxID=1497974 RepID=UPI003AB83628